MSESGTGTQPLEPLYADKDIDWMFLGDEDGYRRARSIVDRYETARQLNEDRITKAQELIRHVETDAERKIALIQEQKNGLRDELQAARLQDAAKVDDLHGRIQQLCDGSDALVADLKIAQARITELENLAIDTGWQLTAARAERDALVAGAESQYRLGMLSEREHQNALSRLVIEKHKEELLVAGAGWEPVEDWEAKIYRRHEPIDNMYRNGLAICRRVAVSEGEVTEDA